MVSQPGKAAASGSRANKCRSSGAASAIPRPLSYFVRSGVIQGGTDGGRGREGGREVERRRHRAVANTFHSTSACTQGQVTGVDLPLLTGFIPLTSAFLLPSMLRAPIPWWPIAQRQVPFVALIRPPGSLGEEFSSSHKAGPRVGRGA